MNHLQKIEHIGIAVKDLDQAITTYTALMGSLPYKKEEVESEGVTTVFFKIGESKIELLHATHDDSPIAKYIDKRGEGIHHIAFAVKDIYIAMDDMKKAGFKLINETPKRGADNKLICFVHPKETNGTLIELCQEIILDKL
jgi:methylmalonyl-CoA/ethylmalonyl-CoA epimerase